MVRNRSQVALLALTLTIASGAGAQKPQPKQMDSYDVLFHSRSLTEQRAALEAVMQQPAKYIPRIQQNLRDYPRLLQSDPVAANRATYVSALVRDPSFPPLLLTHLGDASVLDECEYACPLVFALTIYASFARWKPPASLDSQLTTVNDLRSSINFVSRLNLRAGSIDDVVQGPALEAYRKEIAGKNEEQLVELAGPATQSLDTRLFAAYRLETLVTDGRNRIALYLLALNEFQDGSGEYRAAIYQAIYRAELAKMLSESSKTKY